MVSRSAQVGCTLVLAAFAPLAMAETYTLPFYENFEPADGYWSFRNEWHTFDSPGTGRSSCPKIWTLPHDEMCPYDPSLAPGIPAPAPNDSWTWGPYKFETWPDKDNGGKVFSGQRSGRQPIQDPYWVSMYHIFNMPAGGDLRAKATFWDEAGILCDCDPWGPPSRPNFDVNGGIELATPNRRLDYYGSDKDYCFLGINTHRSWTNYCIATAAEGWVVTSVPRTRGWHRLEIVIHPYTGGLGDAEFWIDGVQVARGHRMPGPAGAGVALSYFRLGGDPAIISESILTNTFEELWYDEVALTNCNDPRPDLDGDGDVDASDFGLVQRCLTGPANAFVRVNPEFDAAACSCADLNGDQDVDADDLDGFVVCATGPAVAANKDCDH